MILDKGFIMIAQMPPPISHSGGPEDQTKLARITLLGHDIRAAVSDIIGGLRLVDQGQLEEITRLQIERVRAASEVLAQLLEEGLQIVAEETGTGPMPAIEVAKLLYDLEMRWSGKAREKGITFHVALAPDVPPVLALDRIAMERALANILSNAIKYTDSGGVRIAVAMEAPAVLRIAVADEGPGFASEVLARLFTPGARGSGAEGQGDKPGQGLGMYISKGMADRLGGRIEVANRPEGGALVSLSLPVRRALPAAHQQATALPDLRGKRVLIAEDSETNQAVVAHMLRAMGAEVVITSDGVQARARAQDECFDLAVIDVEMPGISGLELMQALRGKDSCCSNLPIVACTAFVLRANREAIYAAGADAIVAQPLIGIDQLATAISRAQIRAAREVQGDTIGPPLPDAVALDHERFERLLSMAGEAGAADLLARLIGDLSRVERSLVSALAVPDFTAICVETHVLVAVAGAIGADRLLAEAERLNAAAHAQTLERVRSSGRSVLSLIDRLLQFTLRRAEVIGQVAP